MLTLLTVTGCRPAPWALCESYMARQTYTGPVRWVVVDDGEVAQPIAFRRDGWTLEVVRPEPFWKPGQNTQARNLLAGLDRITADDRLVIVEDDDWYSSTWLQTCHEKLSGDLLIGENRARYYNAPRRLARQLSNGMHASLCSTAMTGKAIDALRQVCKGHHKFIDMVLWRTYPQKHLFIGTSVVGIKGLPGRCGIGIGHSDGFKGTADPSGRVLRQWIGNDAAAYL